MQLARIRPDRSTAPGLMLSDKPDLSAVGQFPIVYLSGSAIDQRRNRISRVGSAPRLLGCRTFVERRRRHGLVRHHDSNRDLTGFLPRCRVRYDPWETATLGKTERRVILEDDRRAIGPADGVGGPSETAINPSWPGGIVYSSPVATLAGPSERSADAENNGQRALPLSECLAAPGPVREILKADAG